MKFFKIIGIGLFTLAIVGCESNQSNTSKTVEQQQKEAEVKQSADRYNELANKYVGQKVPYAEFETIGRPETLSGTNNMQWVAYFPKADFTIVSNKQDDTIKTIFIGKKPL